MGWNRRSLLTVRFAVLLPLVQSLIALCLWQWGLHMQRPKSDEIFYTPTPILVGYGISAPALVFKALAALPLRWAYRPPVWIGHFNLEDLFFFLGVVVLWYSFGTVFDHWGSRGLLPRLNPWRLLRDIGLVILGAFLLGGGIDGLSKPWTRLNNPGIFAEQILFIAWGLVLVLLPGGQLLRALRGGRVA